MYSRIHTRSREGREFLEERATELLQLLLESPVNCVAHASVSSFLHRLGKCRDALRHLRLACQYGMKTEELMWKEEILRRQVEDEETRQTHDLTARDLEMPSPQQVQLG